jgi:hypothetical protein
MVNGGLPMMKPNFKKMTRKDLREYVLKHREDDEAIAALISRSNTESPKFPFPKTDEDLKEMQVLLHKKLNNN